MPVMDEFKEEREKIKNAALKKKMQYYWYYYKYHLLAIAAAVVLVCAVIYTIVDKQEIAIQTMIISGTEVEAKASGFKQKFAESIGMSPDEYAFHYDTSIYLDYQRQDMAFVTCQQKLVTMIGAGELDVLVSEENTYKGVCLNGAFTDLTTFLTKEEIEKYQSSFFYVDQAVIEAMDAANGKEYGTNDFDPHKPELMEKPVPVGIYMSTDAALMQCYDFVGDDVVIGIIQNSERMERAVEFLRLAVK